MTLRNGTHRGRTLLVGLAGLVLALAGLGAPAASAASPGAGDRVHCAVAAETGETDCFATATEAIAFISGGTIDDAPREAADVVADAELTAELNGQDVGAAAIVIGIEYYWTNFTAPALYFYGDVACTTPTSDVDYQAAPLPTVDGINWNNNIRSFQGYNNCWQRLWDFSNCTGSSFGYAGSSADLGAMNDRAECIQFS